MNLAATRNDYSKKSLRSHLMILVTIAIIPTLLFIAVLVGIMSYQQVGSVDIGLKGTTRALSASVDHQIETVLAAMETIILTEEFDDSNFRRLHSKLVIAVKKQHTWKAFSLVRTDGTQVFNTFVGYGKPLPSYKGIDFFEKVLSTKKTTISGFRIGLISKEPLISVALPIFHQQKLKYVLVGSIDLAAISVSLSEMNFPSYWTARVWDEDGIILARNKNQTKFVGEQTIHDYKTLLKKSYEDIFEDINSSGVNTRNAYKKSKYTGWTVVVGIPTSKIYGIIWQNLKYILIGAFVLFCLGLWLTNKYATRISAPIRELARSSSEKQNGPVKSEITEISEVAQALHSESQKSQDAIAIRDTFLSVASHELKTPITSLQLQVQMLNRNLQSVGSKDVKVQKSLNNITGQIKRLTKLIDDLLNVTKISSGKLDLQYESITLNQLVNDVVSQFENYPITIHSQGLIQGIWDPSRLEQVITNLTSNAIKYGQGRPVEINLTTNNEHASIAIKDNGVGIKAEDQHRIFNQFERVHHDYGISGLGMGLWITLKIVKSMQGEIKVVSQEGAGSVFTVLLPLERKSENPSPIFS